MSKINYVVGDATQPQGPGTKVIVHCCNNEGRWGSGFVVALSNRWPEPEADYRQRTVGYRLGEVRYVRVEDDLWVANLIGQDGTISKTNPRPIRYDAICKGLLDVSDWAHNMRASVHMPRMGAGLAGGNWVAIAALIEECLCAAGIDVTVYDLPTTALAPAADRSMRHR